jgi:hypothetical protein
MKRNTWVLLLILAALYVDAWVIQERLLRSITPARVQASRSVPRTVMQFRYVSSTTEERQVCTVWEPKALLSTTGMMSPIYSTTLKKY